MMGGEELQNGQTSCFQLDFAICSQLSNDFNYCLAVRNPMRFLLTLTLFGCCSLIAAKHHHARVPIIDLRGADAIRASVREDENIISTVPELSIVRSTGPVCSYVITGADDSTTPFEARVVDKNTGEAVFRVKDSATLDCKLPEYKLQLQAIKCDEDSVKSEPVDLVITIKDTNNHAPEIEDAWYSFNVPEGRIVDNIGSLKASDKDCGHPNGEICEFQITNALKDLPFAINNQGVIRNTQSLNFTETKSYILTIVAIDCAMRKSKSSLVTIHVEEKCNQGVTNFGDRVNYAPGTGSKLIMPDVSIQVCQQENACEPKQVETTVELKAGHVTPGCTKDTVYDNETIKTCGLSSSAVQLVKDEDLTSGGVAVSKELVKDLVPDHFTFSFSMKHDGGNKEEQSNKQNILCETDDFNMNRHHFSVYIRHCKLEVVLRREAGSTADFRAAEWRWALPQVCDNQWHSYSLMFNGIDNVNVIVDGKTIGADERNPEILDDWPLHKTKQALTKLVVGACWHGRQQKMAQLFKGQLQSVFLLTGKVESEQAIKCAHTCPEQIQFTGFDELLEGQTATLSADQNVLTLKAATSEHISKMLRRVAYVNTQATPTPGHRSFEIKTEVTCQNKKIQLEASKGYIFVQQLAEPTLSISASTVLKSNHHNVKVGQAMVPDLTITISQANADGQIEDVTTKHKIDYCKMHLQPGRDMDVEYFSSPASLIASLDIEFEHDKDGILLRGEESVRGYKEVLSKVHYFNTRPESYNKRTYTVQCAMLKGRVLSNELFVTMSIESSTTSTTTTTESPDTIQFNFNSAENTLDTLEMMDRHFEPDFDQLGSSRLQNILEMDLPRPKALLSHRGYDVGQGAIAGGAVAVVVVVCVGFLLVLLVIGVLKMRDTPMPRRRRQKRQSDGGLHWDDSGMNITVNPLDDVEKNGIADDFSEDDEDDEEEDSEAESECSYRDEEDDVSEDEEEHVEVLPHCDSTQRGGASGGLEWDDEDAIATNSRSYRV
ncbi:unnamed protein product [Caenorhabditis angaria]|uniref:Cadherin domain-containing protein n=1 Tax=Caenorhabditis angaria TaxID=860376 RepID=A0A9P1I9Y8_9PELO|nr:unnamed protein product [Caenorhabditis angaria]